MENNKFTVVITDHKLRLYRYTSVTVKPEGMRSKNELMQIIEDVQLVPPNICVIDNSVSNPEHNEYEG